MVCADRGVQRHLSAPYTPQHNGVVERRNQTVAATACSMLNPEPLLHARRGQQDANGGGLAEYAVAPAALTVARPPEVSAVDGACLPAAASSALQLLKATGVSSNATGPKNVLLTAASGGVGHYAVQLAKLTGMHVTATCGARNVAFVQGLGADEVLDYKTPEGAALRSPPVGNTTRWRTARRGWLWPALRAVLADEGGTAADVTPGVRAALTSLLQKVTLAGGSASTRAATWSAREARRRRRRPPRPGRCGGRGRSRRKHPSNTLRAVAGQR
nr:quinone-oxidoreductase homolog, chloroplastic-like [Lolium perenne]